MKVWQGYGTEHSYNLVMIGRFRTAQSARETKNLISTLQRELIDHVDVSIDHFPQPVVDVLKKLNCYFLEPQELCHFVGDVHVTQEDNIIHLSTDEREISGYIKLMIYNGAKVEVFSGDQYDEDARASQDKATETSNDSSKTSLEKEG